MILAVGAAQLGAWALAQPVPALRCLRWLVPAAVAVLMFAAFRAGMGSPRFEPDGDCYQPYPDVPF